MTSATKKFCKFRPMWCVYGDIEDGNLDQELQLIIDWGYLKMEIPSPHLSLVRPLVRGCTLDVRQPVVPVHRKTRRW